MVFEYLKIYIFNFMISAPRGKSDNAEKLFKDDVFTKWHWKLEIKK